MRLAIPVLTALFIACAPIASPLNADTVTQSADMVAGATSVFSIEFYTDEPAKVIYSTIVPFTAMDPSKPLCYADNRSPGDGKSDVGIVCKSNIGQAWYLKISAGTSSHGFNLDAFKYYMGQPWNRALNTPGDGSLSQSPAWYPIPTSPTTVYFSGSNDTNNLDYGTLATFSYAINPKGLVGGVAYNITITYTMTTVQ